MNTNQRFPLTLTVSVADILDRVFSESAWRCEHDSKLFLLTPDQHAILSLRLKDGYEALCRRLGGYLQEGTLDGDSDEGAIELTLLMHNPYPTTLPGEMASVITVLLSHYVLRRFYGATDNYSGKPTPSIDDITWRKCNAELMLLLARNEMR